MRFGKEIAIKDAMSVNKVILVGRLGQTPEKKYSASGMAMTQLNLATSESWTDKAGQKQEKTEWHRVVVFGKLAETCAQYLTKGRQVYVEGRLQTRQWQDKDNQTRYTTEVLAATVQFLGAAPGASEGVSSASTPSAEPSFSSPFTEEDVPF